MGFTLIQPVHEMIVVEKARSALELESEAELPYYRVLAVGPGKVLDNGRRAKMSVRVGDLVLLMPPGAIVKLKGTEYGLFPESNVLAVLDEQEMSARIKPALSLAGG